MRLDEGIIEGIAGLGDAGDYLRGVVRRGVLSTLDTQMIIDDDEFHAVEQGQHRPAAERSATGAVEDEIENIQAVIASRGLYDNNFHALVTGFGKLLFQLIASDAQRAEVAQWHEQGAARFGGFLMADGGGASIGQWRTVTSKDGEDMNLDIDKVWIIEGHRLDYGTVSSATSQKLYPTAILVPPREFGKLKKSAVGEPFLNGSLQLGNVSGKCRVPASYRLTGGGLASTSIFLSKVRPRFVRALMAHLQWLDENGQAKLSPAQRQGVRELQQIATRYYTALAERKPSLPMAMAIKFASNCILLEVVASGAASGWTVQRDLLAFTRMEGSSYRCLFEIYGKTKVR